MIALICANFLLAITFTLSKVLLVSIPPFYLGAVRCLGTGFLSFALVLALEKNKQPWNRHTIFLLIKTILFGVFFVYCCENWALQYVSTIKTTILYNISTFIVAGYSYIFFQERMNIIKFIGMTIGLLGMVPVLLSSAPQEESLMAFGKISWPEILLIFAMLCEGYGWVCQRILVRNYNYLPFFINGVSLSIGGAMLLCIGSTFEHVKPVHNPVVITLLLVALIVSATIANNWLTFLFKRYSLTLITLTGLLLPVFAGILGYIFLAEVITYDMLISLVMISVGILIFYQQELKLGYVS